MIDIAVNLTAAPFQRKNLEQTANDLLRVIDRAEKCGVTKFVNCGLNLSHCRKSVKLIEELEKQHENIDSTNENSNPSASSTSSKPKRWKKKSADGTNDDDVQVDEDKNPVKNINNNSIRDKVKLTVGVHPKEAKDFKNNNPEKLLSDLANLIETNKDIVAAIGECGIYYDRLQFSEKEIQNTAFYEQVHFLGSKFPDLPFYLHCRGSDESGVIEDFIDCLKRGEEKIREKINNNNYEIKGVCHCMTGSKKMAEEIIKNFPKINFGVTGVSFREQGSLEVIRDFIPLERLHLETDAPYCDVRPDFAGFKYLEEADLESQEREKIEVENPSSSAENSESHYRNPFTILDTIPVKIQKGRGKKGKNKKGKGKSTTEEGEANTAEDTSTQKYYDALNAALDEGKMIQRRNEPCTVLHVCAILAKIKERSYEEVDRICTENSTMMFGF